MASVKKAMKSSETKQAKQPRTRNPKAKASKRAAEAKARQAAAARVLAAKRLAAKKLAAKKLATKQLAAKKLVSKKPATKKLATKKSVQKVKTKTTVKTKTKTAVAVSTRATSPAAKTKAPASTRALAAGNSTASAAKKTAAAARRGKLTLAPTAKRAVATKPVEAVRLAATGKPARGKPATAPKNTPTLKVSPRKAVKPATAAPRKAVESEPHAAQNPAAGKGAAAALLATFKRNVARLSEVRKQAASAAPSVRPAVNPANLSLESNERMAVIKEPEKKKSLGTASGLAGTNAARQPAKDAATGETAGVGGKGAGKPLDMKAAAKLLVSKAPPPIENRPVALAPVVVDAAQSNIGEAKSGERPAALAPKPAKTGSSQRQSFKPGEFVVYPAHGVGQIVAVEEQEVAGFKLELFVISFIKDKMILKVPTPKVVSVGMRKLADASAVKTALDTLAGRARVKRTMWSRRAQEYEAKINSGDLNAIAEVVRDLYRSDTQPEQSYSERQLYEAALDRMTREIVVVQKLTETESLKVIEAQLQKGPRRGKAEEIDAEEAEIEEAA